MTGGRQLPVHSPIPARALARGLRAALAPAGGAAREVRARLQDRFDPIQTLLLDSGTSALTLALAGSGPRGAPVALPAYACYDVVTAALGAGMRPVFYDLDPRTLGPRRASLEAALAEGPAAVVAVHLYGVPVDMGHIVRRARSAGALVIEDAAQGIGGELAGSPLGTHASLSVLSFGRGKGLTGGGGGVLMAHDSAGTGALARLETPPARETPPPGWRDLAAATAQWALGRPGAYGLPASVPFLHLGETRYRRPSPPGPASAASMAIVAAAWRASWQEAAVRRETAGRLLEALSPASGLLRVRPPDGAVPGYLRLPLLASSDVTNAALDGPRARQLGIMPGYPRPLPRLDPVRAGAEGQAPP
ncbi:MAG TPA: DegT/DnrJ/EryC1/StrS family aminotransferase, partial [Gemmatimonadota bacterium]|nr:DegT/DnrJ/EryC1/StrS family aminotransferase [Gemmatimonadota bacterium]